MDGRLPVVPPLAHSELCRMCSRWLEGDWTRADPAEKRELERQMAVGRCDDCTWRVARDRAQAGRVFQPVPDPGDPRLYAQLVLAGALIDLAGRPLLVQPCQHGPGCPAEYHVLNVTDPMTLECPHCGRGPGQPCQPPRPSEHRPPSVTDRPHRERELAAQEDMDRRAAAGDLTVPAPWPDPPAGTSTLYRQPLNGGTW
jgi:hypothetical protein